MKSENSIFVFLSHTKTKKKIQTRFNAIEKRNTKMKVRIPFSNVVGKQNTKNGSGNWNSVFQSRKKRKWKLEFRFPKS